MAITGLETLLIKPARRMNLEDAVKVLSTAAENSGFRKHLRQNHNIENPNPANLRQLVADQFTPQGTELRGDKTIAWEICFLEDRAKKAITIGDIIAGYLEKIN